MDTCSHSKPILKFDTTNRITLGGWPPFFFAKRYVLRVPGKGGAFLIKKCKWHYVSYGFRDIDKAQNTPNATLRVVGESSVLTVLCKTLKPL